METRLRPAAYLGGMTILGVVAALLFATLRGSQGGPGASPSPTASPAPSPAAIARSAAPIRSLAPATSPPATSSPAAASSTQPTALAPAMTPWPSWLTIPDEAWGDPNDTDRDGLTDAEERRLGTDPYRWDTDFGDEGDGSEVAAGRDPKDRADDVPRKSACIPDGSKAWDGSSPSESPPPAPELEALLPKAVGSVRLVGGSMRGLPRVYGLFNYFWDGLLLCAGGQPDDLSHAIGVRGTLPAFGIFAIRVKGADTTKLARDLMSDLKGAGREPRLLLPVRIDGRDVTFLLDGDVQAFTFASYVSRDVLFLMTGMSATDAGLFAGGPLDPELVRDAVVQLRAP